MMTPKLVLDVGNCGPDHAAIKRLIESRFAGVVLQAHGAEDTFALLAAHKIDLVLVNRKLDQDYSDGLEIIKLIKSRPEYATLPVMMITNYPEHQEQAVAAGATFGFGKLQFNAPETHDKLRAALGTATSQ